MTTQDEKQTRGFEPAIEIFGFTPTEADIWKVAGPLGASVMGDFDQGAYGRYDEPVYCDQWLAFFTNASGSPFQKTSWGKAERPVDAIMALFLNVKDRQRLRGKINALLSRLEDQSVGEAKG